MDKAIANAKKIWYYEKWVGRHVSFPPRRSVKLEYSGFVKTCAEPVPGSQNSPSLSPLYKDEE